MKLDELTKSPNYKTTLTPEDTWKLLEKHCSDAMKHLDEPIVRGMSGFNRQGHGIIDGTAGWGRSSKNTKNYYTEILDAILPPLGFPKRSESIICGNWADRSHARGYGSSLYAIIPFNGVKIGVCPGEDMWDTRITLGGETVEIYEWNELFDMVEVDDSSFDGIVNQLEAAKASGKYNDTWLKNMAAGKIKAEMTAAYRKPFKTTTTKNPIYNDGKPHELWIGGKCIAINMKLYKQMMDNPPQGERFYADDDELWGTKETT